MSGRSSKRKGYYNEVKAVEELQKMGFDADRVFGSGAYEKQLGEKFAGDIRLTLPGHSFVGEVKFRKSGFKTLYDWLESERKSFLLVRQDRRPFLFVCPLDMLEDLFHADNVDPKDDES